MKYILLCLPLISILANAGEKPTKQWPSIAPLKQIFTLADSGPRYVRTRICGPNGRALYVFHAYLSAEEFYSPALEIQSGYPQGDLECRLESLAEEMQAGSEPTNLFNKEQNPPNQWSHRGIFWIKMLKKNPSSPLWGTTRRFYLRGMSFTIRILNYKLAKLNEIPYWADKTRPRIKTVTIEIKAIPNPKAQSAFDPRQ